MANTPKKLEIHKFDKASPLHKLPDFRQKNYLIRYLADLGAQTVLEEPNYFDRDYLAEAVSALLNVFKKIILGS